MGAASRLHACAEPVTLSSSVDAAWRGSPYNHDWRLSTCVNLHVYWHTVCMAELATAALMLPPRRLTCIAGGGVQPGAPANRRTRASPCGSGSGSRCVAPAALGGGSGQGGMLERERTGRHSGGTPLAHMPRVRCAGPQRAAQRGGITAEAGATTLAAGVLAAWKARTTRLAAGYRLGGGVVKPSASTTWRTHCGPAVHICSLLSAPQANIWIAIFSFIGNYFWTHYFYKVLGASYTFVSWRLNDVSDQGASTWVEGGGAGLLSGPSGGGGL